MQEMSLRQYQHAEREAARNDARSGLLVHAAATVLVWAVVIGINVVAVPEVPWSVFPVVGMGFGLLVHWWYGYHRLDTATRRHQAEVTYQLLNRDQQ